MKLKYIIIGIFSAFVLTSCYKDLSTEASHTIPDINISGLDSVINILYGETLKVKVDVSQEGRSAEDFTYLWKMDIFPRDVDERVELSDSSSVEVKIANTPSDVPYILSLLVTDRQSGYSKLIYSKVYVGNSISEGLMVASTRDGGVTTDIDLLANKYLTYGYTSDAPRYTRGLYSLANGEPFHGRINAMSATVTTNGAVYNEPRIMLGTDKSIIALDPLTFKPKLKDSELFNLVKEPSFATTGFLKYSSYVFGAIVNGNLYVNMSLIDNMLVKVGYPTSPSNVFRLANTAFAPFSNGNVMVFDENDSKFKYQLGFAAQNNPFTETTQPGEFNLKGAVSLGAGDVDIDKYGFLIKSQEGDYHIVIYSDDMSSYKHYTLKGDGLDRLVDMTFCDNSSLMYYATSDKIYAVTITQGAATPRLLTWKPASSDEKITGISQYSQAWVGTHQYYLSDYPFPLPTNRLQIIVTTYNSKTGEGKIYLCPFNVSTGLFLFRNNGVYGGFGEITAIAPTFK